MKKFVQKPISSANKPNSAMKINKSLQKIIESPRSHAVPNPLSNYSSSKSKLKQSSPMHSDYFDLSLKVRENDGTHSSPTVNRRSMNEDLADSVRSSARNLFLDSGFQDLEIIPGNINILRKELSLYDA